MVSCNLYNFYWVQIDMNHALPHSPMMLPLPRFIYTSQKKGGYKLLWIVHQDNSNYFTSIFRDDHSEYEDHMDISKCIPSMGVSDLSSRDPLEKQIISTSSKFSPEGAIG